MLNGFKGSKNDIKGAAALGPLLPIRVLSPTPQHTPYEITSLCAFAPEFGPNLWGQLGYVYKITWEYGYKYMRACAYIYTRTLTYKHTLDI